MSSLNTLYFLYMIMEHIKVIVFKFDVDYLGIVGFMKKIRLINENKQLKKIKFIKYLPLCFAL